MWQSSILSTRGYISGFTCIARVPILDAVRASTINALRLLSAQEFRSGQMLAERLGVSRASVWGALNEAQSSGINVHRVHGRGYRLATPLDWLDVQQLCRATAGAGLTIEVVDCCESTNALLLDLTERGTPSGRVLAAELQTRGRGRLGRVWHAGLASALTFSVLWRFAKGISAVAGLSLAVGVAIARTLQREGVAAQLKWPNDVVWHGRKLAGILIEVRGDALGPCAAVIGVGLNVRLDAKERDRIDQPVADLTQAGSVVQSRNDWLSKILLDLAGVLGAFEATGFELLREEWIHYSAHHGKQVRLLLPDGGEVCGIARGVDVQGRLLVDSGGRLAAYLSAEVSLRAVNDSGS